MSGEKKKWKMEICAHQYLSWPVIKWLYKLKESIFSPTEWIGLSGVFALYGMTAVVAGVFFYVMLPETKGKTLQEIDKELCLNRWSLKYKAIVLFTITKSNC